MSASGKIKSPAPLEFQIKHFKSQIRCIAERTFSGGADDGRFRPAVITRPNLCNVGFEGKHAAVRFNVYISQATFKDR